MINKIYRKYSADTNGISRFLPLCVLRALRGKIKPSRYQRDLPSLQKLRAPAWCKSSDVRLWTPHIAG